MTPVSPDAPNTPGTSAIPESLVAPEAPESATVPVKPRPAALVACLVVAVLAMAAGLWVTVGSSNEVVDRAGAAGSMADTAPTALPSTTALPPTTVAPPPTVPPHEVLPVSGWGRRVVYSIGRQRMWWVDDVDAVLRTSRVSGRPDMPATGVFEVYSKTLNATGLDGSRMDRFVRFAKGPNGWAIGFHDIPEVDGVPVQSVDQLGEPLSHGCIRQSDEDAALTWDFLQVGDRVVVTA